MPSRHRSRELVVQWLYQWMLNPSALESVPVDLKDFWYRHTDSSEENQKYFFRVSEGVVENLPRIDTQIESLLDHWRMDRLEKVDLAILRVGSYEILLDQDSDRADPPVIINEAVEIAKKFGTKESPSFINGILDKVKDQLVKRGTKL
jgi:N utilization substance protein B